MPLITFCSSLSVRRPSTAKASYCLRPELEKRTSPAEISSVDVVHGRDIEAAAKGVFPEASWCRVA